MSRSAASMDPVDPAAHATHDPLLIAAHAAGDAAGSELDRALALVAGCPACAALHHDLRAIAAALPTLPAPRRPRDFRLTPAQAASLHGSGWRRFLLPLAGPRFAFAGPLGSGLAALGIAGILLSGGFSFGGATGRSAAVPLAGGSEAVVASPAAAQAPAATGSLPTDRVAAGPVMASAAPSAFNRFSIHDASAAPTAPGVPAAPTAFGAPGATTAPQLVLGPVVQPSAGAAPKDLAVTLSEPSPGIPEPVILSLAGLLTGVGLVALRIAGRSAGRSS